MKILVLNPRIDAEHMFVEALRAKGVGVLFTANAVEAMQILQAHGASVDLAIVHREGLGGQGQPGLDFTAKLKLDPAQADLPYILTTEIWSDAQCVEHQQTPAGANAYLKLPFEAAALFDLVAQVTGQSFDSLEVPSILEMPTADSIALGTPAKLDDKSELEITGLNNPGTAQTPAAPDHAEKEMPYLFGGAKPGGSSTVNPMSQFEQPVGDAVVPGGAANSPDIETLKKYLLLREQDVSALSAQLKSALAEVATKEDEFRKIRGESSTLNHLADEQAKRIVAFETEKNQAIEALARENSELQFQIKARVDKVRMMERKVQEASDEIDRIRERVRVDIRKIRAREKELENRLEIARGDSEAMASSRESKIIELKRKIDVLEFNLDLVQDQLAQEKDRAAQLREKLVRASQAMRVAGGVLQEDSSGGSQAGADEPQEPETYSKAS